MKTVLIFLLTVLMPLWQDSNDIKHAIFFGGGSYGIDEEQISELKKIVDGIKNLEYYQVRITSHTDNIGGVEFNQYLSRMRSQAVIDRLLEMNITQDQIRYKDYGLQAPAFDNSTWKGRLNNRRVDILFTPIVF